MSKFRIKMKLQGLELEIEGSREDASLIGKSLAQQFASLVQPAEAILSPSANPEAHRQTIDVTPNLPSSTPRKMRKKRSVSSATSEAESGNAIEFNHDPTSYGNPSQEWKTADKAIWLLYVLKLSGGPEDFSSKSIFDTFNKHFRQSGTITTSNVTRDLGKLKTKKPAPLGENTNKDPSTWYLTDAGIQQAILLVAKATGKAE